MRHAPNTFFDEKHNLYNAGRCTTSPYEKRLSDKVSFTFHSSTGLNCESRIYLIALEAPTELTVKVMPLKKLGLVDSTTHPNQPNPKIQNNSK